jgi:hypothetical protein
MVARSTLMHEHTVGPLPAGLSNRDCHAAQRLLIIARLLAVMGLMLDAGPSLTVLPSWRLWAGR